MLASFSRGNLLGVTAVAIGAFATPAIAASTTTKTKVNTNAIENSTPVVEEVVSVTNIFLEQVNLASQIMSANAYTQAGDKISEVSDIVFDPQNKVVAITIGVGGFLGIDETYVAIPISKTQFIPEGSNLKVVVDVTKEQLRKLTSEKQVIP